MKTVHLFSALAVVLLCGFSLYPASGQEPAPPAPRIVCEQKVFDFGERENNQSVEHTFVIRNEGTTSLEIQGVRSGCGCTAAVSADNVVPPGGETTIKATLNLRGRSGMQIQTITVLSNDPQTPTLALQMRGMAVQGLRVQPATLFFGRITPADPRTRNFEVVSGRGPFHVTQVRVDHPGLLVRPLDPEPGADGSLHRFELSLDDSLPIGAVNSRIFVQTDIPGQAELVVPVAAFLSPAPVQ